MKRFVYLSLVLITLFSFSACHKNSTSPNVQAMIVGKWNLKKQNYVQYANDVKQVDTICIAADTLSAYVQFNADKSFKSEGIFFSTNPHNIFDSQVDVTGSYTVSNSAFTVSKTMAGLMFFPAVFTTDNYQPAATITNSLHTSKLSAITSTTLSIHTEDSYTSTVNSVSTNIKMVNDFYYIK
jgi:hypothetical protein